MDKIDKQLFLFHGTISSTPPHVTNYLSFMVGQVEFLYRADNLSWGGVTLTNHMIN